MTVVQHIPSSNLRDYREHAVLYVMLLHSLKHDETLHHAFGLVFFLFQALIFYFLNCVSWQFSQDQSITEEEMIVSIETENGEGNGLRAKPKQQTFFFSHPVVQPLFHNNSKYRTHDIWYHRAWWLCHVQYIACAAMMSDRNCLQLLKIEVFTALSVCRAEYLGKQKLSRMCSVLSSSGVH